MSAAKIAVFEDSILTPSWEEVCASPALNRDFAPEVLFKRPAADANTEELLGALAGAMRGRTPGRSLVLTSREPPSDISKIGGRYVLTVFYDHADEQTVYASPAVIFWMRFNNKLHVFNHRFDNAIARHKVEDVTRPHVLNHLLGSIPFYKLYAFSAEPFPGDR